MTWLLSNRKENVIMMCKIFCLVLPQKSCLIVFCVLEILETNTHLVKVTLLLLTNEYKIFTTHIVKVTLIIIPSKHATIWPQNSIPQ
jgi:hypothetical protein